jgi:hypothetical protein
MIRGCAIVVWLVGLIVLFFLDMYFGSRMLANLAPDVPPGLAFKDRKFSVQRDRAHFNDLGRVYRARSIAVEVLLLIWVIGGPVLLQTLLK